MILNMPLLDCVFHCWPRCTRRKPKLLPSFSQPSFTTDHPDYTEPLPPPMPARVILTETSKVPAVNVNETDMHCVLGAIFGRRGYEVALNRDIYRITAHRKLTQVSRKVQTSETT